MAKTLLEIEDMRNRDEIAAYLRRIAEKLDAGEPVTLTAGEQEVELLPAERCEFEVEVEEDRSVTGKAKKRSIEIEIAWREDGKNQSSDLEIS